MPIFKSTCTADPHCHPRVVDPDGAPVAAINDFLCHLEQCARSPYTVRAYARGLAHFVGWLHEAGIDSRRRDAARGRPVHWRLRSRIDTRCVTDRPSSGHRRPSSADRQSSPQRAGVVLRLPDPTRR